MPTDDPRSWARAEVEAFQRSHWNHLGHPLKVDGVAGPQTLWAHRFSTLCQARQTLLRSAQLNLSLVEVPPRSNDDPHGIIRQWLKLCNAKPGDPWCAAAASWVLSQGLARSVREGGAVRLGMMFPPTLEPVAGDLFWYPVGLRRGGFQPGHVGIVGGADDLEVMGYEGNCDNAYRCTRRPRAGLNFSRTVEDVSGLWPGVVPSVALAPGGTR